MMKVLIPILIVFSSFASAEEKPVNLLETKVTFEGIDVRVEEVFTFLGRTLKTPPNVVFKGEAGDHSVSSLKVKDVTLGNLFRVLESIADVQIEIIEDHGYLKDGAGHDPFAPQKIKKILTSSGVVVISSIRRPPSNPLSAVAPAKVLPSKRELTTEVIPVKELGLPIDSLIEVITTTWRGIDGDLAGQASIAYHEPTKLLIITAPKHGLDVAQKILGALMPNYQQQLDDKRDTPRLTPRIVPSSLQPIPNSPRPIDRIPRLVPGDVVVPGGGRAKIAPVEPRVAPPRSGTSGARAIPLPGTPKVAPKPVVPADPSEDPFGN